MRGTHGLLVGQKYGFKKFFKLLPRDDIYTALDQTLNSPQFLLLRWSSSSELRQRRLGCVGLSQLQSK